MLVKKIMGSVLLLIAFLAVPAVLFAENGYSGDTAIEKMGDWFATVGKSQDEKDRILLERHTDRMARKIKDSMKRGVKEMEKFGKDMEKALN